MRPFSSTHFLFATLVFACVSSVHFNRFAYSAGPVGAPDFNHDIRPILSNYCFQCHGQDEAARESDLRLDMRSVAIEMGAISPGEIQESELVARITSTDEDLVMPPGTANKPLSEKQILQLKNWIASGAAYSKHWAFEPIAAPPVPETPAAWRGTIRNPVDGFIAQKLYAESLDPRDEADRATLIRRLYQDLVGLLPSIEEVDSFIADPAPDAYEQLVDRLLDSPHYGERWGRHWLDQARYADSHGYTIDGQRVMWPFRDWVIQSLNKDMPFDQFTIEQLAGDLLPEPTNSQLVATAFHRNTMINEEGGVKADEFRHEATIDRVNTTGAVWLGLTVGCAQCHTHKFDPITHDEYYQLYAFFNSAADSNNTGPTVPVLRGEMLGWSAEQQAQVERLRSLRAELSVLENERAHSETFPSIDWNWHTPDYLDLASDSGTLLTLQEDGSLFASGDFARDGTYRIELSVGLESLSAIRLRLLTDSRLPASGPGRAGNGNLVLTDVSLEVSGKTLRFDRAWADHSQPDYPVSAALDDKPNSGWALNTTTEQESRGIAMNSNHQAVFAFAKPQRVDGQVVRLVLKQQLHESYQLGRFAIDVSTALPVEGDETERLAIETRAVQERIAALEQTVLGDGKPVEQMVMRELGTPHPTYRLIRGNFLTPAVDEGELAPMVPAALVSGPMPKFANRLDLAHWLVSRGNPLTARVTVNRVWAKYFGRGLVETENDFGFQGALPTHPALLDWLSAEFMDGGWSLKKLHRLIVTSATYRQSSDVTPELLERDPGNYWLARQSRFRVEAEIIRDSGLVASGLLSDTIGGPSVFPPQPVGVFDFTQRKLSWPTDEGPNRYRRTLYTNFYRSAPYPLLTTFDAPDFSTTCTSRVRSNSPLQSLTLANDSMFIEFSLGLARSAMANQSAEGSQSQVTILTEMFRRCLSRFPDEQEKEALAMFFAREHQRFAAKPELCQQWVGEPSAELAAWTSVARVIMNTDEFVSRN